MLIGGDDITKDIITFGAYFHVFFNVCLQLYICALSASRWLAVIWQISQCGAREGIRGGIQIPET